MNMVDWLYCLRGEGKIISFIGFIRTGFKVVFSRCIFEGLFEDISDSYDGRFLFLSFSFDILGILVFLDLLFGNKKMN